MTGRGSKPSSTRRPRTWDSNLKWFYLLRNDGGEIPEQTVWNLNSFRSGRISQPQSRVSRATPWHHSYTLPFSRSKREGPVARPTACAGAGRRPKAAKRCIFDLTATSWLDSGTIRRHPVEVSCKASLLSVPSPAILEITPPTATSSASPSNCAAAQCRRRRPVRTYSAKTSPTTKRSIPSCAGRMWIASAGAREAKSQTDPGLETLSGRPGPESAALLALQLAAGVSFSKPCAARPLHELTDLLPEPAPHVAELLLSPRHLPQR